MNRETWLWMRASVALMAAAAAAMRLAGGTAPAEDARDLQEPVVAAS
jgi:hypothetical protein